MRTNVASVNTARTHEGGQAGRQTVQQELERAVSTCLLWEHTFYEDGNDIAYRIAELSGKVSVPDLLALAVKARTDLKLRHVPLFLLVQAFWHPKRLEHGSAIALAVPQICLRPDEMGELIALYWKAGKRPLPAAMKRGLAQTFTKFGAYALAKWNKDAVIKLRDVLFLVHAKPKDEAQATVWKKLVEGTLESPDTWEVALSSGQDKKATWERLLREHKLGDMALLMNVRNMVEAKVDKGLIEAALLTQAEQSKALPFRYVSAAKAAPSLAAALSDAMLKAVSGELPGATAVVIDVSGSMDAVISGKSVLNRWEAAGALAILVREICPRCEVYTFSNAVIEVANYRGLPLIDAIGKSQSHGATYLAKALDKIKQHSQAERVIVITDEQSQDGIIPAWTTHAYLVNVAPYKPGLDTHNGWTRISGWSERVVDWIRAEEASQ